MKRILCIALMLSMLLSLCGCASDLLDTFDMIKEVISYDKGEDVTETTPSPAPEVEVTPTPTPAPTPTPTPTPTPDRNEGKIIVSMVGDCTLASSQYENSFDEYLEDDYSYPFAKVMSVLGEDDFTIANLENSFSDEKLYGSDPFLFYGPSAYAKILVKGSISLATMGNNHTNEFGSKGVANTKKALDAEGVAYLSDNTGAIYEIDGMKLGVFVSKYLPTAQMVRDGVTDLKNQGADIIIACIHWGLEGRYRQLDVQENVGRAAIDAGADIVCGTHPHVLEPVEEYNGGYIMYSLGNFSFGGNTKPRDTDSAIAQAVIEEDENGTYYISELKFIPVSISGDPKRNNFQPVLLEEGTEEYERVLSKLDGTFNGPNLSVDYSSLGYG